MREIWHIYYGTRGSAGLYIHSLQNACHQAGIKSKSFVSCYYTVDTPNTIKCFFPLTDGLQRRNIAINIIRGIELACGYIFIAILASFRRPRISINLTDDTIITYTFYIVCRMLGLKIDVTCHDVVPHDGTLPRRRLKMIFGSDRIIVHNHSAVQSLKRIESNLIHKIIQYPFPCDSDASITSISGKMAAKNKLEKKTNGHKYILLIGIIRESKGIVNLLEAWKRISFASEYRLLIAGKWSGTCLSQKERALHTEKCIVEDRYLTDDEFAAYLDNASFVVLPYLEYTHSAIIFRCADHNAAVIISDILTFKELMSDYKLTFKSGNTDSLTKIISLAMKMGESDIYECKSYLNRLLNNYRRGLIEGVKAAYNL